MADEVVLSILTPHSTSPVGKATCLVDCKGNSQLRSMFACLIDANLSHFDKTVYYTVLRNQNLSLKGKANTKAKDRNLAEVIFYG